MALFSTQPAGSAAGRDGRTDWRLRRKRLSDAVRVHPRTTPQINDLGIYPSYEMLCRNLRIMRRKGLIRHQGTISLKDAGRPVDYYCAWPVKRNAVEHELDITDIADRLDGEWKRGRMLSSEVKAIHREGKKDIWPDAIVIRNGIKYWLEYDSTEQSLTQVQEKLEAYEDFPHKLLFVTRGTMDRLKHVAAVAKPVAGFALFTTLDLITDPKTREHEAGVIWYGTAMTKAIKLPG